MPEFTRRIVVHEDGTATLERRVRIPSSAGAPPTERVIETKIVDAAALLPNRGELFAAPPNCQFARSEGDITVLVVEEPPRLRTVTWRTDYGDAYGGMRERLIQNGFHLLTGEDHGAFSARLNTQTAFTLAFPYVVKCYTFQGDVFSRATLFFRPAAITDDRAELFLANLPNYNYSDQHICFNSMTRAARGDSFARMVASAEHDFWSSPWNDHWTERFFETARRIPEVASPWEWEYHSRRDPAFVLSLPWRSAERIIGDEVSKSFARVVVTPKRIFDLLAARARAADPYDRQVATTDTGVKPSPASEIALANRVTCRVGDTVVFDVASLPGITAGVSYTVEWFSRVDTAGGRLVKLASVERPQPIIVGGELLRGVRIVAKPPEPFVAAGITFGPDTRVAFTLPHEWPERTKLCYGVTRAKRGPTGDILVVCDDEEYFTVIGRGEELFPGVQLSDEATDEHGLIRADTYRLRDGTEFHRGEKVFVRAPFFGYATIAGFLPFAPGDAVRFCRFTDGVRAMLEDAVGRNLAVDKLPGEDEVSAAPFGGVTVKVGDEVLLQGVTVKIVAFSPLFPDGARYVQLRGESGWRKFSVADGFKLPPRAIPVLEWGGMRLKPGMHLRLAEDVKGAKRGKRFRVLRIVASEVGGPHQVVFGNGLGFDLTAENAAVFTFRGKGKKKWHPLPAPKDAPKAADAPGRPGEGLGVGVRVRYLGGDFNAVNSEDARTTPATIVDGASANVSRWGCRFDRSFEGLHDLCQGAQGQNRDQWIYGKYLVALGPTMLKTAGFSRVFTPSGAVPDVRAICVNFGAAAGKDTNGREIKIGDRVRAADFYNSGLFNARLAREYCDRGGTFTVVHQIVDEWYYILADEDLGTKKFGGVGVRGADEIPIELLNNPAWYSHVVLARKEDCKLIT